MSLQCRRNRLNLFLYCASAFFLFQLGCKKLDLPAVSKDTSVLEEKFFSLPATAPQILHRVAGAMRAKNNSDSYVEKYSKCYGMPFWEKAIVRRVVGSASFAGSNTSNSTGDTLVIIPLVLENTSYVYNFITARVSHGVILDLFRGSDYDRYSFDRQAPADTMKADLAAMQIIWLNNYVFGHTKFIIKDPRLLSEHYISTDTNRNAYVSESSGNNLFTIQTTCVRVQSSFSCQFNYPGGNGLGCHGNECVCTRPTCNGCYFTMCSDITIYTPEGGGEGPSYPGNGGSTGGGPSPTPFPCPSVQGKNLPAIPCGDDPGPPPVTPDILIPPFIWVFSGDDGTVCVDPDPTEEPDFILSPSDEAAYPRFSQMVRNLKTFVKDHPKVMSALQRYSGFSKQQILNRLTYGQGPVIHVEPMNHSFGFYKKGSGLNHLHIRKSYVQGLEVAVYPSTQEATAFLLAVTILHEFVHLGTTHNNISEGGV